MADKLIIVESPAKANTIKKFLGGSTKVVASMGHIRDLPKSKLGIDIEHDFEPEYINIRGKGDLIKSLKTDAKKAKKELWYEINRNSLFLFSFQIYSNCPLKRNRFLLMLLFPNIILALIPLFLWYCGIVFISPFISRIIGSLLTILFTCGASDYSLFFDTVLCTKKEDNIIIFKNEFYSSNTT